MRNLRRFKLALALRLGLGLAALILAIPKDGTAQPVSADVGRLTSRTHNAASAGGGPIGSVFPIINESETEVHPAVAHNSEREEYLVVWYNDRSGNDDIRARRVSKNGRLVGDAFPVSAGSGADRRYPDVAYNSRRDEYLVVWEQQEGSSYNIRAQRASRTGQLLGGAVTVASPGFNEALKRPAAGYASTSDKYLVVWQCDWEFGRRICGRRLSSTGTVEGNIIVISSDSGTGDFREQPDLAYNRARNEFLVVWKQLVGGDYDIRGRRVKGGGDLLQPESIGIGDYTVDEVAPAVTAIPKPAGDGQYLVVWELRYSPTDGDIYARQVAGDGTSGSPFPISIAIEDQTKPAVAGNESADQYLVAWTQPWGAVTGIRGGSIPRADNSLSEETWIGGDNADHAAVASGPLGDFLIAFDDVPLGPNRNIYGRLWGNRVYLPCVLRDFP